MPNTPETAPAAAPISLVPAARVDELVRLYESRSREVPNPEEAANLLARAGALIAQTGSNPPRAEELFRRSLVYFPNAKEALEGLVALAAARKDDSALAEALERLASANGGEAAAQLYLRAGELHETKLNRRDRAVVCYQLASRAAPMERGAYRKARKLLLADGRFTSAFESLERERAALGDRDLFEEYVGFAERVLINPYERGLVKQALSRAAAIDGSDARVHVADREYKDLENHWREKADALRAQSLQAEDPKQGARLSLAAARLCAYYEPQAVPTIKEALDRCFALWPAMPDALELLERVAEKMGDVRMALTVFSKLASESREKSVQVDLQLRIGQMLLTKLNEPAAACDAFLRAANLDPSRADASKLASELLVGAGRIPESILVMEQHLVTVQEPYAHVALRETLADMCVRLLKDEGRAQAHLEAARVVDPHNANIAYRLVKSYADAGELEKLWPMAELAISAPQPVAERVALCEYISMMCEEAGDERRAFQVLAWALPIAPARQSLLDAMVAAGTKANLQAEIVSTLRRTQQVAPAELQIGFLRLQARLLQQLERRAEAKDVWRELLKRDPEDEEASTGVETLKTNTSEIPLDQRALLELEAAKLESQASDSNALSAVYRKQLALDPDSVPTLKKLFGVAVAGEQWEEAATVSERLTALADSEVERQDWRGKLAQLLGERLNRRDESARLYLGLLAEGVESAGVIGGLERLAGAGVRQGDISRALAPVYAKNGDHQRQVASMLVQLGTSADVEEQKSLLGLLAQTSEQQLGDPRAAFDFYVRGLTLDPAHAGFRAHAMRLSKSLTTQRELARVLYELATKAPDADSNLSLSLDAAVLAEQANAPDEAAAALNLALTKQPENPLLLAKLSELFARGRRWAEFEPVLRRRLAIAAADEKADLASQLVQTNIELGRPKEAAAALVESLKFGASELDELPKLIELYESAGMHAEQAQIQERLISLYVAAGQEEAAMELRLRRAKLLETALGDTAEAISRYAEVLAKQPGDAAAHAALESLLTDSVHREAAGRVLLTAYRAQGDARKQAGALSAIADASKDTLERINLLREAADLHAEQLKQPEQAFFSLATAVRLAPTDAGLRALARSAAEDADAIDSYVEMLEELVEASPSAEASVLLHRELADLFERKLDDHRKAVTHLNAALAVDAKSIDALRSLTRLHRAHQEWIQLVPVLENLSANETDGAVKMELDREAAVVSETKLEDAERAVANWRLIVARDPSVKDAAIALDRLCTQLDQPDDLAFALELRRSQEQGTPAGRDATFRLAQLRVKQGQRPGALELLRQLLTEDPHHAPARTALEAWVRSEQSDAMDALAVLDPVLASTGDHQLRIALREARLPSGSAEVRARLSTEIRQILERDLDQPEAAFMSALKAFTDGVDRGSVQPELERLAQATGSYDELAEIYESCADEVEGAQQLPLLRRAAELREKLNAPDEATRLWKRVRELAPDDGQALDRLSKLYETSENARSLADVFATKADLSKDSTERRELLLKAAEAFENSGDDGRATQSLEVALSLGSDKFVLVSLERLYAKNKRRADQARVLGSLLEHAADDAERVEFLVARASALEADSQPVEAIKCLAEVLSLAPTNTASLAMLERLLVIDSVKFDAARLVEPAYRQLQDHKKLVEVLELRLPMTDATRRLPLLLEIASLRESTGQKSMALAVLVRAFNEADEDADVRRELERLSFELGAFEELAATYEDALDRGVTDSLALELWRRLAMLYQEQLSRFDKAAEAWNQVLARNPRDLKVLEELARLYERTASYKELSVVMRRQLALYTEVDAQVQLLHELASLAEETLADKALAAQCYQAIIERKPDDPNASKFLARILSETDRHAELAALLTREIQKAQANGQEEEALDVMVRLGRLKVGRLNDPRGGFAIFQEVLRRRPAHVGAVGALEEMARSDNSLKGEAASALEPVFAGEGEHLKLVQMIEARVGTEQSATERASLLRRMADVYSTQMDNAEMGFVAATRALKEVPDDPQNLAVCMALYKGADAADELMLVLTEVAPKAADDRARAELYRALAKLQTAAGEDEAVDSWKRVVEILPTDAEAMTQVGKLLGSQGRAPELIDVLKRQLTIEEDPDRRVALLHQLGSLQDEQLDDAAGALTTFRRVLELKPDDELALSRLDALCEAQQRWPELADIVAKRLRTAPPEQHDALTFRLASVRETKLLDKAGAIELYRQILQANPRQANALARLEAMVQREPQNQPAVEALLDAYRRASEQGKLAQLIEARTQVSPDAGERRALLKELASIRDGQGEPELAYLALYRAFKEDPNDADVRARMESAADAAQSHDELAGAYEAELPRISDSNDAALVCLKLGQLQDQRLGDQEQAVVFYEKARQLSAEVGAKALGPLDRLYGQLNQPAKQADVLEALVSQAKEPQDRIGVAFRLGQLAMEHLDSPDRAAAAFEQVLAVDPKHLPALRSLEALYEHAKMSQQLYRVLEAQSALVQGAERERIVGKMAVVSSEGLADVDHSISLYRDLLAKNPRNEQAFEALSRLLDTAKRHDELVALLQQRLAVTIDPRELVRLNERLGRVLSERLDRPEEAIPHFKSALERDPRHRGALEALRDIFDRLGKKEDLVIVLKRLIPLQEDSSGVKQIRIRLAETIAQSQRREEALDAARRALEVEPHALADLDRIHDVFFGLKAYADAVRALELKAQVYLATDDREPAVETLFNVVDLWRGVANKPDSAGPVLERILELEPSNRTAYDQALELYSKVNDWRSYATAMDRFIRNLVTDEEKNDSLKALAKVQETKLGQKDTAFLSYCRALQLMPSDDEVREQVERLADETGSHDELAAVYDEVADGVPRGPLAERMYLTLARVHDQKLDDPDAAEAALRKILDFDPTNASALDRMASMFSRRGRNKEYVISLEQKLEAADSLEGRKEILREIARVYESQLDNVGEAENALLRALELEPDLETLGVLVSLQRRQKNHEAVSSTLLRMRDIAPTPEERSKFQLDVATVYERDLKDDEAAVEGYRQALEFDPANNAALESLERLYTKLDRPAELLSVYERQLEITQDYRERVRILFKSANIWEERYQNLGNADACIDSALQLDQQNLQAIKTLERLRKAQGRWDELIGVVDRHISLLTSPTEKAALLVEMGDIFHQQLKAVDRAVTTYHQALELDPSCRPAIHALGTLYERSGNWPFALDMLSREARVLGDTPEAVELLFRQGKINEDMLLDLGSAKESYLEALRIDAGYLPAIRALKGIYQGEGDSTAYEKALVEEARQTEDPEEKSRAFLEVAKYYEAQERPDDAAEQFEEALTLVPDSLEAARPLADIYLSKENWERCEYMLDIVTDQLSRQYADASDDVELQKELCRRYYRLGYVCEKNDDRDKALRSYEKAYQLDATYLPVLEGYGNLLGQTKRYEEGLKVYQSILVHHRGDLTDLEVAEIYWTLGDFHLQLKQYDRAENHFEKSLGIDGGHEPSLRAMVQITETTQQWEKALDYRQKLLNVVDGDARFDAGVALGKLARTKANDPYIAIDAYLAANKARPGDLEVLDALYVLYRETKQGAKGADVLEKMLAADGLKSDVNRAKRVWFALGEISRDELMDIDRAVNAFNRALDLDYKFIEAFSAVEALLGRNKKWKTLDENYKRMLARFPKTPDTNEARMTIWKALGDLYLNVMKAPDAAAEVYKVVATGLPDNVEMQELYASVAQTQPGHEQSAVEAWRRALPTTASPGKVASALAELAAKRKDYDAAYLAAQVVTGLIGESGAGEKEIITKLTPYAKKREVAQRQLTDRLWQQHVFHPKVRGPLSELMGILFEQAGTLYKEEFAKYGVNPKRHLIDTSTAQEYQIHHYRYVSRLLGMEQVAVFSPFLVTTRERLAKKTSEPAPDPMVGVEVLQTEPVSLRLGGKFFQETGQKEVYYLLGRTMALMRPELALTTRVSAERLEAIVQAAISLAVERFRFTADLRALDVERKLLDRHLTEQARAALIRVCREYVKVATPNDLRNYLEGAELSATRAGAFVAGDIEPVKRMVLNEAGSTYRVQPRSKIRDLMVFALGDDLGALRKAVGTNVEVQLRK